MKTILDRNRRHMPSRLLSLILICLSTLNLQAQQSQPFSGELPSFDNFEFAFPEGDALRNITKPVFLGEKTFIARLEQRTEFPDFDKNQNSEPRPPLGIVLCGGSARAYAHIGVLKILEKANIYPDFIVASSMGAVVGMLYAAGYSPQDIEFIIKSLPLESFFTPVIPTNGGLINTDMFKAILRKIIGRLDVSETAIPIIIIAEDLKSRQQIWIAEGPFDLVMASAFAMPAIFEPQEFDNFVLIDAGATTIAPVEPALIFSDRLVISTAFYNRAMDFSSPVTVINRAVDIGKTRSGMAGIERSKALVIRNDVENLSYMQFTDPDIIIEKGELSAQNALEQLDLISRKDLENPPSPEFFELRSEMHENLNNTIQNLQSGQQPSTSLMLRGIPILRLFDPFISMPGETGTEARIGASLAFSYLKFKSYLSYFNALNPDPGKVWAIETAFRVNPLDSLNAWFTARLWGDYSSTSILSHDSSCWELASRMIWMKAQEERKRGFHIGGDIFFKMDFSIANWQTCAFFQTEMPRKYEKSGPSIQPWYSAYIGAFAENSVGLKNAVGLQGSLQGGFDSKWVSPKFRAFSKVSLNNQEFMESKYDGFRSIATRKAVNSNLITNVEIPFSPHELFLDISEALLLKGFELAPFFDTRWNSTSDEDFHMNDWAAGLSFSFEARAFGLAPATMTFYASYSGSKIISLQFRAGMLL